MSIGDYGRREALKLMYEPQPAIYPQGIVLIVLAGIGIILCIPPLIWHISKKNHAVIVLIVWFILLNLMNVINPILWPNDDLFSRWEGYGLCDVEIRLQLASYIGLPGALAVIVRDLSAIFDTKNTGLVPTSAQKTRNRAFLIFYCYVFPLYITVVAYVVQPNRYNVLAIAGCTPSLDYSWLSLVLVLIWPVFVSALGIYYAVYLMIRMYRYRAQFSRLLQNANTNKSGFRRLFLMSITLIAVIFPVQIYVFYVNVSSGIYPYSWSATHNPRYWPLIYPVPTQGHVLFDRWIRVAGAYTTFFFFGFGRDATKMYKRWMVKIGLGRIFPSLTRTSTNGSTSSWGSIAGKARSLLSKGSHKQSSSLDSQTLDGSFTSGPLSPTAKSYLSSPTFTEGTWPDFEIPHIDKIVVTEPKNEEV